MKEFVVEIEETVVQNFEIEAENAKRATKRADYKKSTQSRDNKQYYRLVIPAL